ncbi:helix-turn-helix domain-containing protein [Rhodanobacter aciditrophus]|uniref:helix-turn-helix domain-containing protein n=1 Tax=Rhodanobacter aciditrophus TaxID=1623218 RepID=UPI003CF0FFF8
MYCYRGVGLDNVYLQNGYTTRTLSSGEEAVSIHDLEGLHAAIARELVEMSGEMDGKIFRFLRKYADMAQRAVAELMDVTVLTVSNWERDVHPVPTAAALLLRGLVKEILSGNAELKKAVDRCNQLDRKMRELERLQFADTEHGWQRAA